MIEPGAVIGAGGLRVLHASPDSAVVVQLTASVAVYKVVVTAPSGLVSWVTSAVELYAYCVVFPSGS